MRKLAFIWLWIGCLPLALFARHIKGGEISYRYAGPGAAPNTIRYEITLRLFLECNAAGQQLDAEANVGIYYNADGQIVGGAPFELPLTGDEFITLSAPDPCIKSPSQVCYRLRTYTKMIDLPQTEQGYTAVFQRCCRIDGLSNLSPNRNIGSSYTCQIHGTGVIGSTATNSSPSFAVKDTILICQNRPFHLDFSAFDPDGDSLSYSFSDAYDAPQGGGGGGVINPSPPAYLNTVSYAPGFSGAYPLGPGVNINPGTGLISGIAPKGGDYVISVTVKEWRKGVPISQHRKDFNIRIDNQCDLAAAELDPSYQTCDDYVFNFRNEAPPSSLIHSYNWYIDQPGGSSSFSQEQFPVITFPDTGVYKIKLVINKGELCSDSASSIINVFPNFTADFAIKGSCEKNPIQFIDQSQASYGTVNGWSWLFGDETSGADSSHLQNPQWKYSSLGNKNITLIASSSKGCIDTVTKSLTVRDKPPIALAFKDTLICNIDSLQLKADGSGQFSWSPQYNIINAASNTPIVYPQQSTWYQVELNELGCINTDSVHIRVVDHVSVDAGADSLICLSDSVQLNPVTDGLYYKWSPAASLSRSDVLRPIAVPTQTTLYTLEASIGKCRASDEVRLYTVPYPMANAGRDTIICFQDTAQLHAQIKGSSFTWSPGNTLSNISVLNPYAYPAKNTIYLLSVYDTLGCPKPGRDSVQVNVLPEIMAFAGNDTVVIAGQPLQLQGRGAEFIEWYPRSYLNDPFSANPVAMLPDNFRYIMKAYTTEGCYDLDTINIKVFKTRPDIFVPNAFSPTGNNRLLRPIPVGIQQLDFFRVYNRWGQLVFQTNRSGDGWDGTLNGRLLDSGTYVWMVQGRDYLGNLIKHQGTAILVR